MEGRTARRPPVNGPPPLLYQPVLVKYPYVEPELTAEAHRHPKMAGAKTEDLQRAFAVVASVALALIFTPGLYSTAYRATFPAFLCGCL